MNFTSCDVTSNSWEIRLESVVLFLGQQYQSQQRRRNRHFISQTVALETATEPRSVFFLIFNCYIPNSCSTLQTFHSTPMCHSTPAENCWFRVWSWKRAHLKILINLKVSCWLILSAFCLYGFEYKHLIVHLDTFLSKTKNQVHGPKLCLLSL